MVLVVVLEHLEEVDLGQKALGVLPVGLDAETGGGTKSREIRTKTATKSEQALIPLAMDALAQRAMRARAMHARAMM